MDRLRIPCQRQAGSSHRVAASAVPLQVGDLGEKFRSFSNITIRDDEREYGMFSTFGYDFAADVDGLQQNAAVQHEGPQYQALQVLHSTPCQSKCVCFVDLCPSL